MTDNETDQMTLTLNFVMTISSLRMGRLMLVTDIEEQMCWWQLWYVGDKARPTSRIRHQHKISVNNIIFWQIIMSVTDISTSDREAQTMCIDIKKFLLNLGQNEFYVSNITYRSSTSHSRILWCWPPIDIKSPS